jgi:hypothetical protein
MHTIFNTDEAAHQIERYATWIQGTIHPHASLWIVYLRFLILNLPSSGQLNEHLGLNSSTNQASWSRDPLSNSGASFMQRLSRILNDPISAMGYSDHWQLPMPSRGAFGRFHRYCPSCLAQGFHTILFSINGLSVCPAHGEKLGGCWNCGRSAHIDRWLNFHGPGVRCRCGIVLIRDDAVRKPIRDMAREGELDSILSWLLSARSTVFFHSPADTDVTPQTLGAQLIYWERAGLMQKAPASLHLQSLKAHALAKAERCCLSVCGIRSRAEQRERTEDAAKETDLLLIGIFKAVRRYIMKHVLAKATRSIAEIAMSGDRDSITKLIQAAGFDPNVWRFFLWWQACMGSVSLRDWFRRRLPQWERECQAMVKQPEQGDCLHFKMTAEEILWTNQHLYAAHLARLWCMGNVYRPIREAQWGRGALSLKPEGQGGVATAWTHGRTHDGSLFLWVDRPSGCWPLRTHTSETRQEKKRLSRQEREFIVAKATSSCVWYHPEEQTWTVEAGPRPCVDLDFKRRILLHHDAVEFILVKLQFDREDSKFAARCLDRPLATIAQTPKEAIQALKTAMHFYQRITQVPE